MTRRERLLDLLRVPPAPTPPAGDEEARVFRAAPNYFRYRVVQWLFKQAGAVFGLMVGLGFLRQAHTVIPDRFEMGPMTVTEPVVLAVLWTVEILGIALVVAQAAASLLLLRLDFEQRWYIVTDRSLRIREGLVRLHEKTMTFANIQHLTIEQGPLQRLLGIADLQVRTAGGGGKQDAESGESKRDLHIAYFRGVADPERIRDAIRERLRRQSDAGLGDPDDPEHLAAAIPAPAANTVPAALPAGALRDAALALRDETRALRERLAR